MTDYRTDGGPAFPQPHDLSQNQGTGETVVYQYSHNGMMLRDYFAAKALQGCFSFWVQVNTKTVIGDPDPVAITKLAYEYADAMLKARAA